MTEPLHQTTIRSWDCDDEGVHLFLENGHIVYLQFISQPELLGADVSAYDAIQALLAHCDQDEVKRHGL